MEEKLNTLELMLRSILNEVTLNNKEVLNINEVATFTSLKKSYLYKLNHEGKIPSYSYSEKGTLYFKRSEIVQWMTQTKRFYKGDVDDSLLSLS